MQTATQPIQTRRVEPAVPNDDRALNPTATRYGWCPWGDISLVGADGTINLYVQPLEIDMGGRAQENEYHRLLPKGQLIPFPTFTAYEMNPSPDARDSSGKALLVQTARQITAKDAIEQVLFRHSAWGFTVLNSLQGVDQDTAFRIFAVVQPLEYPLSQLVNELSFGASERIDAVDPIKFPDFPDYVVEPLRSDLERHIARQLAGEMEAGAEVAFALATETLNATEVSMTTAITTGKGKVGPDPLDRRLSDELNRDLPKLVSANNSQSDLGPKVDFLVSREADRATNEKIAALEAENARLKAAQNPPAPPSPYQEAINNVPECGEKKLLNRVFNNVETVCGATKPDGESCNTVTKSGEKCRWHKDEE